MSRICRPDAVVVATAAAMVASLACNRHEDAQSRTVPQATEAATASVGCNRPQTVHQPAVAQSTAESAPDSHHEYAWWVTARFAPAADTILSLPVNLIDSSWSKATVLTRDLMPSRAGDDPSALASATTFGFCFDGDFNRDGKKDRAAVGVYQTRSGEQGRFLLILTETGPDRWQKTFLHTFPGDPGFSLLSLERGGGLGWWTCMACDNWAELAWADTAYVLKFHPGGEEQSEDTGSQTNTVAH